MKNIAKKFFSYITLVVFLSQSIMTQVVAMSAEEFADKSLHAWIPVSLAEGNFKEFEAKRATDAAVADETFFDSLIQDAVASQDQEAAESPDWDKSLATLAYISQSMRDKDSENGFENFDTFFQVNIHRFDPDFQIFANQMRTFVRCVEESDKAERTRLLKAAVESGNLGQGVFLLEAFRKMKWDSFENLNAYTQDLITRMPDSPYFDPYKKALKLESQLKQHKLRWPQEGLNSEFLDAMDHSFKDLCAESHQIVDFMMGRLRFSLNLFIGWGQVYSVDPSLVRNALINSQHPIVQKRVSEALINYNLYRFGGCDVGSSRPFYEFVKNLFEGLNNKPYFILKMAEAAVRFQFHDHTVLDIDPEYLKGGLTALADSGSLEARVFRAKLNMGGDINSLFEEVKNLEPSPEKYELLPWVAGSSYTRATIDRYRAVLRELNENYPHSQKGMHILASLGDAPHLGNDQDPTDEQWRQLLDEVVQLPWVTERDSGPDRLFQHLFPAVYSHLDFTKLDPAVVKDYDDQAIRMIRHFMSVCYYSMHFRSFVALLDNDFSQLPPMSGHLSAELGYYLGDGFDYLEKLLNRQLERRNQVAEEVAEGSGAVVEEISGNKVAEAAARVVVQRKPTPNSCFGLPDELERMILSFLTLEEMQFPRSLWQMSQGFARRLEESLYHLHIDETVGRPIQNAEIFDLFPGLHSLKITRLADFSPFGLLPRSLRVIDMKNILMKHPVTGNITLWGDIFRMLDNVGVFLNTAPTILDSVRDVSELTIPQNLWQRMPRGQESRISRLSILGNGQDIPVANPRQPRVMEVPALEHLDVSTLPANQVLEVLGDLNAPNLPLLTLSENVVSMPALRDIPLLRTISILEITRGTVALTRENLESLLNKMPALKKLTLDWSGDMTAEEVWGLLPPYQLEELTIRNPVASLPINPPRTLSSLTVQLQDGENSHSQVALRGLNAPKIQPVVLPQGAISLEGVRNFRILERISEVEIVARGTPLSAKNLRIFLGRTPALKSLILDWTGDMTAEEVWEAIRGVSLENLEIRRVINSLPSSDLPASLSSLRVRLQDGPNHSSEISLNNLRELEAQSLTLPGGAVFLEGVQNSDLLSRVSVVEIQPGGSLTRESLRYFLTKTIALKRLTLSWSSGLMTGEDICRAIQDSDLERLEALDINLVGGAWQSSYLPVVLPSTLSSLTIRLKDYSDMMEPYQILRASGYDKVLRIKQAAGNKGIPRGLADLLTLSLKSLYLNLPPRGGSVGAVLFATVLARPDVAVREVVFPEGYPYFDLIVDALTGIQYVPAQDNGVRIRME